MILLHFLSEHIHRAATTAATPARNALAITIGPLVLLVPAVDAAPLACPLSSGPNLSTPSVIVTRTTLTTVVQLWSSANPVGQSAVLGYVKELYRSPYQKNWLTTR